MNVLPTVMIDVDKLRPYSEQFKKAIGPQHLAGIRACIKEFGFSASFNVALDADGLYTVLDGNTRLDELQAAGVKSVSCIIHDDMAHDQPDAAMRRKQFVLSFDRSHKVYDEPRVLGELKDMVAKGYDPKKLSALCNVKKLQRIVDEDNQNKKEASADVQRQLNDQAKPPAQESMVLYGPVEEIAQIKKLLKLIRGRFTTTQKVVMTLEQANANLDIEEDAFLSVLLATIAKFQDATIAASSQYIQLPAGEETDVESTQYTEADS